MTVYKGRLECVHVRVCMYVVCMCVPVVVCIRHDERLVTSRAIVHRPPARSLDRSIVCVVYARDTSSSSFHE